MRLLLLLLAGTLRAEPASVEWLVLPSPAAAAAAGGTRVLFSVDGRGRPWLLRGRKDLVCPVERVEVAFVAPADGLAHVGGLSPLVAARGYLGSVPVLEMVEEGADGRPKIPFKPLKPLPRKDCRLAPGAAGALYALCVHAGRHEVYLLRKGKGRRFEPVFASAEPVLAAAGDGDATFVSVGQGVVKAGNPPVALFSHPSGPVRDLAYDPAAGLFYAAGAEVGRWKPAGLERLLSCEKAQIRALRGELYVFSETDWGVARLSGL